MTKIGVRTIHILMFVIALTVVASVAAISVFAVKPATAQTAGATTEVAPVLIIEKSHVMKLSNSSVMMIMGAGFPPNEEVRLLISQMDGSVSDIGAQLDPAVIKANKFGVWGAKWTTGDFAVSALAKAEMYVMYATDANYNKLAVTPFGYYNEKAAYKDWPSYARAIIADPAPAK